MPSSMMSPSQSEKIKLEHEAARLFMRLYEAAFQQPMRHIWHNEPRKPDVSCYLDNQKLDLEIAHLYGSEAEAMLILGREINEQTLSALHHLLLSPVEDRLLEALNTLLLSKAQKTYHSERVWLVIRNANPLWNKEELIRNIHLVYLPDSHPFEQIWVIGDMQGSSGIIKLYP